MPFLEVLTRCYRRPKMLTFNQASLERQTDPDWTQTLLVDESGAGVAAAQERLGSHAPHLVGDYIWILDDDDECVRDTLVAELKEIAAAHDPDLIMLRMDHGERGILPGSFDWEKPPAIGRVGCSAYVVRRQVWRNYAGVWFPGRYHSDGDFIRAVYAGTEKVYWHDVVASRVQWIGFGRPEPV